MRDFLRNNMLILVLLNYRNIFNCPFQRVAGRRLSAIDYGSFKAMILAGTLAGYFLSPRHPLPSP